MGSVSGFPAFTDAYGCVWITRLAAAPGLTSMLLDGPDGQSTAREAEGDGPDRTAGEVGERRHAAREGHRGRADKRAVAEAQRCRDDRAAVAGLDVAVLIQLIDHRLGCRTADRPSPSADGWVWIFSRKGAAGLIRMLFDGPADSPPPENASATVPAVVMLRPAKVATPCVTVTDVVPSGRPPLESATLTTVVLSFVSMLPS